MSLDQTHLYGKIIYIGFQHIASLKRQTILEILTERKEGGVFRSIDELCQKSCYRPQAVKHIDKNRSL